MRLRGLLLSLAVPLLFASACGQETASDDATGAGETTSSSQSPSSSSTPSTPPPDAPRCAATWQGDATLPKPYDGCWAGKEFIAPESRMCSFGKPLVTYDQTFWAVPGGTIHEAAKGLEADRAYISDMKNCEA